MAQKMPAGSQDRKDTPVFSGFMKYFPLAMAEVARLSKVGNDKHNPNQPLHWDRTKSLDHGDCIARHQLDAGTIDDEDGFYHDVKVAWRAMAQLETLLEENLVGEELINDPTFSLVDGSESWINPSEEEITRLNGLLKNYKI